MSVKVIKKANWIKQVKSLQEVNRELVMRRLDISEEEYHNMWLDAGRKYLTELIGKDKRMLDMILDANVYWRWWLNQWQKWDEVFLREVKLESPKLWHKLYDRIHDPSDAGIAPNRAVLREIFRKNVVMTMIKEEEAKL